MAGRHSSRRGEHAGTAGTGMKSPGSAQCEQNPLQSAGWCPCAHDALQTGTSAGEARMETIWRDGIIVDMVCSLDLTQSQQSTQ